ncbi:chemotaxis protein CheA [Pseudaeromonas sp. ZJS20]|uniref:chemotaxis protein CheA n=1 Tax=Pseudaeromonas aegiceratis TaxID=3153928 RepID=UPI00390CB9C1
MFSQEQWANLLADFLEEARELIQQAEAALLELDQGNGDPEILNGLFRAVHTLKGSAGLFALDAFVAFTHQQESLIMRVRDEGAQLDQAQISALLAGLDVLRAEVVRLGEGAAPADLLADNPEQYARLLALMGETNRLPVASEPTAEVEREPHDEAPASWHISLRFSSELFQFGFEPASFLRYLGKLGQINHLQLVHAALPQWRDFDAECCYLGMELELVSPASKAEIEAVFEFIAELSQIRILPPESRVQDYLNLINELPEENALLGEILIKSGLLTAKELAEGLTLQASAQPDTRLGALLVQQQMVPPAVVEQALTKQGQIREKRQAESAYIKVSAHKMDELINLVGELVISAAGGEMLAKRKADGELLSAVSAINRHVEQIRESALRLRMVEIGETFVRFQRLVRDASQDLGKQLTLRIEGGETELDKSVVERISEPLTHLVRNAVDHGIESPEERQQAGKPAQGSIGLNAYHESGSIVIEVRDDGRGLDPARIKQKAIQKGLIPPEIQLSDSEVYQLIFEAGFSTAEQVSNLSGRGVGMDVVRRNVEALRGTIELDSELGAGCCVRIRLPLTLAIIDGFLVSVGDTPLVIPLEMVTECLEADGRQDPPCYDYRELRGRPLPLVHLRQHFSIEGQQNKRENIVVVRHGKQQLGLIVDQLLGEQQIVIKPLGSLFSQLKDISGSSILGSGQVALILDIPGMLQRMHGVGQHSPLRHLAS